MTISDTITHRWDDLSAHAQEHIRESRPHLLSTWDISEDGEDFGTVEAADIDEAEDLARDAIDTSCYDTEGETIWCDYRVRNRVTGESTTITLQIDPEEPDCVDVETHDWRAPHSVLGGLRENPGVWGHGGGVIYREVCRHCGAYRVTDTWAQRPDTGEQGLRSVKYEDADADSMAWVDRRDFREVSDRLSDLIEVTAGTCGPIAYASIPDPRDEDGEPTSSAAEDLLRDINAALAPRYVADWTGNGNTESNGTSYSDIAIERAST